VHPDRFPLASLAPLRYSFSLGVPLFDLSNQKDTPPFSISQATTFENNSNIIEFHRFKMTCSTINAWRFHAPSSFLYKALPKRALWCHNEPYGSKC
jgi:hypothetical protein